MGKILSIHSYRGGTGKSNIAANLAYLAARAGKRVAVLDSDLQAPGVHLLFGFDTDRMPYTLSDFFFNRCGLEEAAYNLKGIAELEKVDGSIFLLPSRMTVDAIMQVIAEGYDAGKLNDQLTRLIDELKLDLLFVDTHPGFNEETLLTVAISDTLIIILRPDKQDYHGTAVLVEVAGRMAVPHVHMLANKVYGNPPRDDIRQKIQQSYGYDVIGVLPFAEEMARLGSDGIFAARYPSHPLSKELDAVVQRILA
ncbi:MAG TPA: MinD/ParA family protein [Candidatus Binatia bacterium]|nr:MinD/ParA family protein [Candidatus Binatia bacterium]